jgi:3'-5' exoribonuclease
MVAKRRASRAEPTYWIALEAASAASFQPLNAHTSAGARSPWGRRSQISGCIRFTVHHAAMGSAVNAVAPLQVSMMRAGQEVIALLACTRKERLLSRAGSPYLALELRDRSGSIEARAFRDADVLGGRFERGDVVRVGGRIERFRDQLQLELRTIARVPAGEVDPAAFLPVAYRDLDELEGFVEHLAGEVYDPGLRALLDALLGDRGLRTELRRAPCTRAAHHAYLGGLLEHTVSVATLALELAQLHPRLDRDLLLCAAIVHDIGKTREFTYGAEIGLSDEGRLLGHLQLGLRILDALAPPALPEQRRLALAHCVLCHHGPEPAPGRRFASAEAVALQRLNALDAGVKGVLERGLPG